ncbi:stress-activated map kinase interacting protein 1-domain-containing protein [Truncatella angustata]|uniref:Stress-activated map kinase interacting protein 1-domain-containing protein n=1 Tax=Truncatella angustata TaxID=152316 RepID=A0A9P8ULP3_9PEZI|nr:stress-activated map kinase interacting protein 1-domain-containing protein [Truncatella angustata]KAH6654478.1 stress-activated map kinase interacting protein 1-domain-containing protein [Truncatella angustata]
MSLIQVEDLVSYQLRTSYLSEVADGVGERLITLNDNFLNTAPFKAAGWRTNPALIKRTHSPPIPTAIASEYFQAPPRSGLTLEDDVEEGGMLTGGGTETPGPGLATRRRRERRREREMEEDDSSDLSDESDDEPSHRESQQLRFAKMPVRNRSGSSPIQSSTLRQNAGTSSPRAAPGARRGSQSALETVKERARRDTVTSSEVSSDNEFDNSAYRKHKEAARAAAKSVKLQAKIAEEPTHGVNRIQSEPLAEEEDDSDLSDASSFVESVDSASILPDVENPALPSEPGKQVVGTPPKQLLRQSTVRKPPSHPQPSLRMALPPPRPMSTIRPLSMMQPRSLLSDAFKAKNTKPAMPFEKFATLSGQGDPDPFSIRIYAPFSKTSSKPFEVPIRKNIQDEDGSFRAVTVAELIGLSLWRYHEEKLEPPIPSDKLNVNWWTLRMVDGDEVDDDFPPLERKKPVNAFTTANNRAARSRGKKMYDDFGLVQASADGFQENQKLTPQFVQQEVVVESTNEEDTPKNTPQPQPPLPMPFGPRPNPITNTTFRVETAHADKPPAPAPAAVPASRGQQKLLRIHIMSSDVAPGQMVTLDVTTDTYLAEVLDLVCNKRQLDKNTHVLKLPGSGAVVFVDRSVSSIGNVTDLELHRRRFATDGPLTITGSPIGSSPKAHVWDNALAQKKKKDKGVAPHPLAQEAMKFDEVGSSDVSLKKYVVWKKQTMRFVGNERLITIDGEYVYIQPSSGGKPTRESGKTTSVHFSNILNCSTSRKHPGTFKLYVFRDNAPKRTDYEAKSAQEASEIVTEIKKGFAPYNKD